MLRLLLGKHVVIKCMSHVVCVCVDILSVHKKDAESNKRDAALAKGRKLVLKVLQKGGKATLNHDRTNKPPPLGMCGLYKSDCGLCKSNSKTKRDAKHIEIVSADKHNAILRSDHVGLRVCIPFSATLSIRVSWEAVWISRSGDFWVTPLRLARSHHLPSILRPSDASNAFIIQPNRPHRSRTGPVRSGPAAFRTLA